MVNQDKVDILNRGLSPIVEPKLAESIRSGVRAGRLKATTDSLAPSHRRTFHWSVSEPLAGERITRNIICEPGGAGDWRKYPQEHELSFRCNALDDAAGHDGKDSHTYPGAVVWQKSLSRFRSRLSSEFLREEQLSPTTMIQELL